MQTKQQAGKLGGLTTKTKHGINHYKTIGTKGGSQTSKTHPNIFYVKIGTLGAQKAKEKKQP